MVRGFYLTATNMVVQRRKLDVISNNVANVETTGYRAESLVSRSFEDMLINRIDDGYKNTISDEVGPLNTGVHIDEVISSFDQGPLRETGKSTDFALTGDGFFAVGTPAGERYTRDGGFMVNADGYLVTAGGFNVLGTDGQPLQPGTNDFSVDVLGNVTVEGNLIGRMRVVQFADNGLLRRVGDNLFTANGQAPQQMTGSEVKQSFLEGSNVQVATEMVDAMGVYRIYETSQRFIRMIDETLDKAVNEIGRV